MSNLVEIDPDIPGINIFENRKQMGGGGGGAISSVRKFKQTSNL